jgi:hypothetical protein
MYIMKKTFTAILFAVMAASPTMAQQMLIDMGGVENQVIDLDNFKEMTFNGPSINIEQTDGTTSSAYMADVSRIYFGDFSAIENVKEKDNLIEQLPSDEIAVNCPAGTVVSIYSITGSLVLSARLETEGGHISVANIPQGIYIVKANDRTAKFVRR